MICQFRNALYERNVTKRIPVYILMSLANKYPCIVVSSSIRWPQSARLEHSLLTLPPSVYLLVCLSASMSVWLPVCPCAAVVGYLGHGKCSSLISAVEYFLVQSMYISEYSFACRACCQKHWRFNFASSVDWAWFFLVSVRCCNKVMSWMSCSFPQLDVLCFSLSGCLVFFHNWMSSVFPHIGCLVLSPHVTVKAFCIR